MWLPGTSVKVPFISAAFCVGVMRPTFQTATCGRQVSSRKSQSCSLDSTFVSSSNEKEPCETVTLTVETDFENGMVTTTF